MRYHKRPKTQEEWEKELRECLQNAKQELANANDATRQLAKARYSTILSQFARLILEGTIPPQDPCYDKEAA
jgi:hypothetical protein